MEPFLRPIPRAWLATGPGGAPNYDEFADCDAVRALDARRPGTILPVDLPGCFPGADPLAEAARALQARKDDGRYRRADDALLLLEITGADGVRTRACVGLVDTAEISSAAGEPGRLLRNEEVFADTVAERQRHLEALRHLISAVLLVPADGAAYATALDAAFGSVGVPDVTDTDEHGVTHRLWLLDDRAGVLEALAAQTFFVADGNHRSLAAQRAGLGAALVVVAEPAGLRIEPYDRVLRLPMSGGELVERAALLRPTPIGQREPGGSHLAVRGGLYRLDLTPDPGAGPAARLPHSVLEQRLIVGALGLDPASVTYVGGAEAAAGALARVEAGEATAAVLLRPVTTAEFAAVNAARLPMPRKSTWFVPKARSGLVLAEL